MIDRLPRTGSESRPGDTSDLEASDSDLIFKFEMDDHTDMPVRDSEVAGIDHATRPIATAAPSGFTKSKPSLGQGIHRSSSAPPCVHPTLSSAKPAIRVPTEDSKTPDAEEESEEDGLLQPAPILDTKAAAFVAKLSLYNQPAPHMSPPPAGPSSAGSANAARGAGSRTTAYTPLAAQAIPAHQGSRRNNRRGHGGSSGRGPPETQRLGKQQNLDKQNQNMQPGKAGQQQQQQKQKQQRFVYSYLPQPPVIPQTMPYIGGYSKPWPAHAPWPSIYPGAYPGGYIQAQSAYHRPSFQPVQWQYQQFQPYQQYQPYCYGYPAGAGTLPLYGSTGNYGQHTQASWHAYHGFQHGVGVAQPPVVATAPQLKKVAGVHQGSLSRPSPVILSPRPLIVNGSKHNYDVELLNRFDDYPSPSCPRDPCPPADASLPSLTSNGSTLTGQNSAPSTAAPAAPDLVSSTPASSFDEISELDLARPSSAGVDVSSSIPASTHREWDDNNAMPQTTEASNSKDSTEPSLAAASPRHASLLTAESEEALVGNLAEVPAAEASSARQTQALTAMSDVNHWILRLPRAVWPSLIEYVDDAALVNLIRVDRRLAHANVKRVLRSKKVKKEAARLVEMEERAAFVTSQMNRLVMTANDGHPSHRPRYSKACSHCNTIRQETFFPKIFTQPGPMDAAHRISASAPKPVRHNNRPLFVPYIPVPSEISRWVSAFPMPPSIRARPTVSEPHAQPEYVKDFGRCCFDCAVVRGLIKPGERVMAMDDTWRWVCKCPRVHDGTTDGSPCERCHSVPY